MRTLLNLSILSLAFCVGCTQHVTTPGENAQPVSHEHKGADCAACESSTTQDAVIPQDATTPDVSAPNAAQNGNETEASEVLLPEEPTANGQAAEEPAAGIISSIQGKYAAESVPLPPIADLTAQIDDYVARIGTALDRLDGSPKYEEDAAVIVRDASALAAIALAVGLAEEDSNYKASASHIIVAAQGLATAKNFEDGQKAFAALQASLTDTSEGKPLAWTDKVADLVPLMQSLPNLSSTVGRLTNRERSFNTVAAGANARALEARQQVLSQLAALAAVSQGSIPNVVQTEKPDAVAEWKKYCEDFRDIAIKTNAAAHQFIADREYSAYEAAFNAMSASCDDCHRTFYPSAVGKTE